MKIPFSWLKEFLNVDLSPSQIEKQLTMIGLEVEGIHSSSLSFSNVIVARVDSVEKHPNADSLVVATVFDGQENLQIVCGAPNCRSGIKTALARVGGVLNMDNGGTLKVKKSSIRGVESYGMLCSAKELQIGSDDNGIIEFENHLVEGADVGQFYSDTIFDISITPNLGHCLSIYGIARELAASLDVPLKNPWKGIEIPAYSNGYNIQIESPEKCLRYSCGIIEGIKVAPSPEWLQKRLTACGIRPLNNVVDVTNYILLEMGQPLHAFDKETIEGKTLYIKLAKDGDSFNALDGSIHILNEGDITICDEKGIIALGGVMGSEHSKVNENTQSIVLESACFDPLSIRKTSRRLSLISDSSYRFEKGMDIENCAFALVRASQLLAEIGGCSPISGLKDSYAHKKPAKIITCRLNKINKLLGIQLGSGEVEAIFHRLGMKTRFDSSKEIYTVEIPSWRNDLNVEVDLIEEIARLYGYDNIPREEGACHISSLPDTPLYCLEKEIGVRLVAQGLQEIITCDLIGPNDVAHSLDRSISEDALVRVIKPCSIDQSILRPSLLPGMLQAIKYNIDHQNKNIQAFEIGKIHYKQDDRYFEEAAVGIVLTGLLQPDNWKGKGKVADFFDMKGIIENFIEVLRILPSEYIRGSLSTLHPGKQALVINGQTEIGGFGEVHPSVLAHYDISQDVYFAEFNLSNLMKSRAPDPILQPLPIYPSSERDWTITLDNSFLVGNLLEKIKSIPSHLLQKAYIKDVFQGEQIGEGKRNVTLRFIYRDDKKTILQQAVDTEHARLIQHVNTIFD